MQPTVAAVIDVPEELTAGIPESIRQDAWKKNVCGAPNRWKMSLGASTHGRRTYQKKRNAILRRGRKAGTSKGVRL
ncbi:unnamed protein product [Clavelina lepadiformis]|uniref:Uncharacterized protein n=1 Tax=Clavelina lepadiformis TaxID=159417 RepID=A0ABP0G9P7_CLALP